MSFVQINIAFCLVSEVYGTLYSRILNKNLNGKQLAVELPV